MILRMGKQDLEYPGPYIGELREATDLKGVADALQTRMEEDGYLLIRGLLDKDLVLETRRQMVEVMAERGMLDSAHPKMDAVKAPEGGGGFFGGANDLTRCPAFQQMVASDPVMRFFETLRGGPIATYDYKWLRVVGPGDFTGAHYDIVYMGRGTPNVCTCWIPIGDCPFELGPLALLVGSHRFERIKETYGKMDVDRDHVVGWFTNDPVEMVDRYGGRWATTEFEAGDALIFGMYTMHGSLTNTSDRYRISSDTRYQLASEPLDERWVGREPKGHYAWTKGQTVEMTEARAKWGV
ncbi:MAG: phytanoyl-CoA dioxygenase family protein [Armatimonadetes bacterium]|nr:phytanoyl-CoA dioxygenase family protein [Armatimonadota bacterium]